jgi:hypothetical protein
LRIDGRALAAVLWSAQEVLMARKRKSGKATKTVARKKVAKRAGAKRKSAKTAKKPRRSAKKSSTGKATVSKALEQLGAMDLLRAWSPSRYSTR